MDLGRTYRETKVVVLSGEEPIMNMDVSIGLSYISGAVDTRITSNDR